LPPFFSPQRLKLPVAGWRTHWRGRIGEPLHGSFGWLAEPAQLAPGRRVRFDSLLRALASLPAASRGEAERALLRVVLDGRGAGSARWLGSQLRVKTHSWSVPPAGTERAATQRLGGDAGWLADGTPVWFGAAGSSSAVLQHWAERLSAVLPTPRSAPDSGCVLVDYFARYRIRSVQGTDGAARPGPLQGRYAVRFKNGQTMSALPTAALRSGSARIRPPR
jgi:uncharacterized protein YfaQ (DUF2300 family)